MELCENIIGIYNNCMYLIILLISLHLGGCKACGLLPSDELAAERAILEAEEDIVFADAVFERYVRTFSLGGRNSKSYSLSRAQEEQKIEANYNSMFGAVTSLSGIGHFKGLKFLEAKEQELERVCLSSNVALVSLNLSENAFLTEAVLPDNPSCLEVVDMSNCVSLKKINLAGAYNLRLLNLSGCVDYKEPLDLSQMLCLEDLKLHGTHLEELDIRGNPRLWNLDLSCMPKGLKVRLTAAQNEFRQGSGRNLWHYDASSVVWLVD